METKKQENGRNPVFVISQQKQVEDVNKNLRNPGIFLDMILWAESVD